MSFNLKQGKKVGNSFNLNNLFRSYIRPHKMSGVTSSFIGAVQQVFVNGNPLLLYSVDTAKCSIVQDEEKLPCATTGVTKYAGPPCGEGK